MQYPRKPGIYLFTNKLDGMVYVGKTNNLNRRLNSDYKNNMKKIENKSYFLNALRKYGLDGFDISILAQYGQIDDKILVQIEAYYIRKYDSSNRNKGYNICKFSNHNTGLRGKDHPRFGKINSIETTNKILNSEGYKNKRKSNKKVKQIDPITKEVIKIWNSVKEAGIALNNGNFHTGIHSVCTQTPTKSGFVKKTALGFKWEHVN